MKLYRFSPISNETELVEAIKYIHFACHKLCYQTFGEYLANAGNVGIFCHYDDEYENLTKLRKELTEEADSFNQKYYRLHKPMTIAAENDVPEATYTHLYIRQPDIYRAQVGDIDFYTKPQHYSELKVAADSGKLNGARIFSRPELDMIELFNPDIDVLAYVSTHKMTERVRVK